MGIITLLAEIAHVPVAEIPSLEPVVGAFLNFLNNHIGNIGWTMVLFTLMLKIVMFPLDYMSRKSMKKNTIIQERLKDEFSKLEKQCHGDKQLYNQKMMVRMKKEGYSMGGACLPTIITLLLFFYILSGLNSFATHNNAMIYNAMAGEYNNLADKGYTQEQIDPLLVDKYKATNPNWLWVKNPWRPDTWVSSILTADEAFTGANGIGGLKFANSSGSSADTGAYNKVMGAISKEYSGWNGFMILPILAMVVSFLSQWIMQKLQPQPEAAGGMAGTMKFMMYLFPIMMVFFAIQYTSSFAIYIVCNSLYTLLSTILINWAVSKRLNREFDKKEKGSQTYRR